MSFTREFDLPPSRGKSFLRQSLILAREMGISQEAIHFKLALKLSNYKNYI